MSEVNDNTIRRITGIVSNFKSSRENIGTAESELADAELRYKRAKQEYDRGELDASAVKEALEGLSRASLLRNQAKCDFQVAMIGLEEILKMDTESVGKQ